MKFDSFVKWWIPLGVTLAASTTAAEDLPKDRVLLPVTAEFKGENSFIVETSGQVLARFDNDRPAIIQNTHGQGRAFVFNWVLGYTNNASDHMPNRLFKQSVEVLPRRHVLLLHSRTQAEKDRECDNWSRKTRETLDNLGLKCRLIEEEDLEAKLKEEARETLLIVPVLSIPDEPTVQSVARFVEKGGTLIWIDGVRTTTNPLLHEVLGVAGHVKWWGGRRTLTLTRAGKAHGFLSRSCVPGT